MVGVAQLVEHQVVILAVAGSSPVSHPNRSEGILPSDRVRSIGPGTLLQPRLWNLRADLNWVIQLGPWSVKAHPAQLKPMAR